MRPPPKPPPDLDRQNKPKLRSAKTGMPAMTSGTKRPPSKKLCLPTTVNKSPVKTSKSRSPTTPTTVGSVLDLVSDPDTWNSIHDDYFKNQPRHTGPMRVPMLVMPPKPQPVNTPPDVTKHVENNGMSVDNDPKGTSKRASTQQNAVRVLAPLDSYAEVSTVSKTLVKHMGLESTIQAPPADEAQELEGFVPSLSVNRIGTVELALATVGKVVQHRFEVVNNDDGIVVGMDLFPTLGFYIGGVPTRFPEAVPGQVEAEMAHDAEEFLHPKPKPWTVEDMIDTEERDWLLQAIEPAIRANDEIDQSQPACPTIAEATMFIPLTQQYCYRHQYRTPSAAEEALNQCVEKWIKLGHIEPGDQNADFNSPLLVAPKKDAEGKWKDWRICMDMRGINALMITQAEFQERMPTVAELLQQVEGFTHASAIDLSKAYQQLPIAPQDRIKTTFTFKGKKWQWARWPYGLTPATVKFQKVMEIALEGIDGVVVYVDDLLVVSNGNAKDHAKKVKQVMDRLNQHGLKINRGKSHFGFKEVLMLGHKVAGNHRTADPLKIQKVFEWPEPTSSKGIERLLGFTNFLREYIPKYASITAPLEKLKKVKKFNMSADEVKAFRKLKQEVLGCATLSTPDPNLPFHVATDACQSGLGAVLYQEQANGKRKYIQFAATSLKGAQLNYPATKRELLGMVFALNQFHTWIFGQKFVVYTDHKALTALHTKSQLSYTLANWLDVILRYDFEVRHRPGVDMVVPDALSRIYSDTPVAKRVRALREKLKLAASKKKTKTDRIVDQLRLREEVRKIAGEAVEMTFGDDSEDSQSATLHQPIAIDEIPSYPDKELKKFIAERHLKVELPVPDRFNYLQEVHSEGHFGAESLFEEAWHQGFFWEGMRKQCREIVSLCKPCIQYNISRQGFHPIMSLAADNAWDHVAFDVAGPFPASKAGNQYALIMVDVKSRFLVTRALPNLKKETMAQVLYEVFATFGPPKIMQSDNGVEFINSVVRKLVKAAGIDHRKVATYNPRANGLAERFVKTVKAVLNKKLSGESPNWDLVLPGATLAINKKDNKTSKTAPFTLFFGRQANAWNDYKVAKFLTDAELGLFEAIEEIEDEVPARGMNSNQTRQTVQPMVQAVVDAQQEKSGNAINQKRKVITRTYPVGAMVFLWNENRQAKAEPYWMGPMTVARNDKQSRTYTLLDIDGEPLRGKGKKPRSVPVSKLKWISDTSVDLLTDKGKKVSAAAPRGVLKDVIETKQTADGTTLYLVKWKDPDEDDTWLTAEAFDDPACLVEFYKRKGTRGRKVRFTHKDTMYVGNTEPKHKV